ncbi:hypothetical protein [uncultured Hoeflea sp.]|uniref:hypothetical protein n=1 Tax=uncultured Hoeflea sp. TaxID=538666 RepID=UPI0030DBBD55|tara:strand:+ start:4196 stop:4612 length:417 start_codon:yes stop_codon:yes gene_type:complete
MTISVYLIDSGSATISGVRIRRAETEEDLRRLLKSPKIRKLRTKRDMVVIIGQDERHHAATSVCFVDGAAIPVNGNLIIAGIDGDLLENAPAPLDIIAKRIELTRPMLDPVRRSSVSKATDFTIRLVKQRPAVQSAME